MNNIIMKKGLIFIGGVLTGMILCFCILLSIGLIRDNGGLAGATYFDKPTKEIHASSFKVLQVIDDHAALVNSKESPTSKFYLGPLFLMVNNSDHFYYDDEIIEVSRTQKVVQLGIYKYNSNFGEKTVPIIGVTKR